MRKIIRYGLWLPVGSKIRFQIFIRYTRIIGYISSYLFLFIFIFTFIIFIRRFLPIFIRFLWKYLTLKILSIRFRIFHSNYEYIHSILKNISSIINDFDSTLKNLYPIKKVFVGSCYVFGSIIKIIIRFWKILLNSLNVYCYFYWFFHSVHNIFIRFR